MSHVHPLDPPSVHTAAAGFGKLVAMGLTTKDVCLPYLMQAALDKGYRGDETGLWVRLSWAINDSAADWQIKAARANFAVRQAIAPRFDASAPTGEIQGAAVRVHEAFGEPLRPSEVIEILSDELEWWRRRLRQRRRR